MTFFICPGDARFAWTADRLRARGLLADAASADCLVSPLPCALPATVKPGATLALFGASATPRALAERFPIVRLNDEPLMTALAYQTAEGALCEISNRLPRTLRGCPTIVIGYGRIARALHDLLIGCGADVTVAARSITARTHAAQKGACTVSIEQLPAALKDARAVISTPPAPVFDERAARAMPPGGLVLDLASPPYGVDLDAARQAGLTAWRAPGLPGTYCPESAGDALLQALSRAFPGSLTEGGGARG